MSPVGDLAAQACAQVLGAKRKGKRRLVALVGPPASGKSTLAERLAEALNEAGCASQVVPMDGFHLHNQILVDRGLLDRKGAPETFDARGVLHLVTRLSNEDEVYYPLFDRTRDISIAGAGFIPPDCDTVIVEGNYLLMTTDIWRDLKAHWDVTIRLDVAEEVLRERLIQRWLSYGLSRAQAETRADANDLANARLIWEHSSEADLRLE